MYMSSKKLRVTARSLVSICEINGQEARTSDAILVGRLDFSDEHFGGEWPEDDEAEDHCARVSAGSRRGRIRPTFVPEEAIAVAHLPLAGLGEIKDAYAEADVVEDAICVLFVDFRDEGVVDGCAKVGRVDGDGVLVRSAGGSRQRRGAHLEDGEAEHARGRQEQARRT